MVGVETIYVSAPGLAGVHHRHTRLDRDPAHWRLWTVAQVADVRVWSEGGACPSYPPSAYASSGCLCESDGNPRRSWARSALLRSTVGGASLGGFGSGTTISLTTPSVIAYAQGPGPRVAMMCSIVSQWRTTRVRYNQLLPGGSIFPASQKLRSRVRGRS